MKEKSKAKGLSEWKLIPDPNTGAIYTPLTCDVGSFKDANCRLSRAYLNQWRETLKLTNLPAKSLLS
ncbi:hypothetical protein [Microcoleus sp. POL10_C6]|uniref:hypothetical protein n=1 Tax=unclassified Microcoleus TaxID=2642155 RepID=UPI002FD17F4B